jgi:predicted DsbA family dithiol-disulfide isomerase
MTRIEVFADVVCPFAHFGLERARAARSRAEVHAPIRVRAWPLEVINGAPLPPEKVRSGVDALRASVAPDLFKGFDVAALPRTSLPAFGLAAAAYAVSLETGEGVSFAVREALFERGLDVSDPDVLRTIGDYFDVTALDPCAAAAAATADWHRGRIRGVRGSPHFFVGDADWFCPSLDISRVDDHYEVAVAAARVAEFYDSAFGLARPEPVASR